MKRAAAMQLGRIKPFFNLTFFFFHEVSNETLQGPRLRECSPLSAPGFRDLEMKCIAGAANRSASALCTRRTRSGCLEALYGVRYVLRQPLSHLLFSFFFQPTFDLELVKNFSTNAFSLSFLPSWSIVFFFTILEYRKND